MKRLLDVIYISLVTATLAYSQAEWKLDNVHSSITFTVSHMVISDVTGNFRDFSIALKSDKEDFSDARIESIIKVASINTQNDTRDNHLKSDDFFNAVKYPEIKFKSTAFEKIGNNKYKMTGDLTIRDVTKKVVFDVGLNGVLKTDRSVLSAWKATATINRFDYNLKWNKTLDTGGLIVGQDVIIHVNLELNR